MAPTPSAHFSFGCYRSGLGLFVLAFLSACAPSGPITRDSVAPSISAGSPLAPVIEERLAQNAAERADRTINQIASQLKGQTLSVATMLTALAPYSINELSWQAQANRQQPQLYAWLRLAVVVHANRLNPQGSERAFQEWQRSHRRQLNTNPMLDDARQWLQLWRAQTHGPSVVGVILPKSSGLAKPGESIQDGMMEAWFALPPELRPRLHFYYTDDDSTSELISIVQQAQRDQVEWFVGPLAREQVDAVLRMRNTQWPIPTVLLNTPSDGRLYRRLNEERLAFALRPEVDAQQAAQYAHAMGLDRALVLAQDTAWGQRMVSAFSETFKSLGRQVVEQAWYNPASVDHSILLESVLGLNESKSRIAEMEALLGTSLEAEPQRRRDIEMIFMASRAEDARQIRPQLQFFRADDLPVVSVAYALDGAVDSRRDVDLEGVLLPMAPWFIDEALAGQQRREAERRYPSLLTNPSLSHLHAMGRDLTEIIRYLEPMRQDHQLALAGMTGDLSIDSSGEFLRILTPVTITNGRSEVQRLRQ